MFKVNDYVVYRGDVCKIVDIHHNALKNQDYYVLVPFNDDSLKIDIPIDNRTNSIRSLITKSQIDELIKDIPNIKVIESSDKLLENEYKNLLNTYSHSDLIKIIKTTYLRNKERTDNKKKVSDRDNSYFNKAEKRLYTEFSIVLNLSFDETKEYIIKEVENIL